MILAGALGAILSNVNTRSIFMLSLVSSILYTILSYVYITNSSNFSHDKEEKLGGKIIRAIRGLGETIRESFEFIAKDNAARNVIVFNSVLSFCIAAVFAFWQPVVFGFGGENYSFMSLSWVFIQLSILIGNLISPKVISLFKNSRFVALYATTLTIGVAILYGAFRNNLISILACIVVFEIGLGIIIPLREAGLNLYIQDSEKRATILSFQSMFMFLFNYFSYIIMGIISAKTNILLTWKISGGLV